MFLSAGENPAWIARQMGHTNMNMVLQKYGRYLPDHDPLAGQKIIARMAQIGHKPNSKNQKSPVNTGLRYGGASGTRTPDTRIMIPVL